MDVILDKNDDTFFAILTYFQAEKAIKSFNFKNNTEINWSFSSRVDQ